MKRSFQGIHRPLLPAMLTIDAGQPQPSAAPTPSQPVPTPSPSHVQITQPQPPPPPITSTPPPITQPPPTLTQPVQSTSPPPQPSSVQLTSSPPPIQPDTQPTHPPSPQIPSPSYHDTEGPSLTSYHMSPPPSHEPEIQTSRTSEESEQLRNLLDLVPRLESRVESLEKELSDTKQTLGTAILQLIEKIKKFPFLKQITENEFATPEKSKDSGEAQADQISPSTLEAAQILTNVASEGFKGSQAPLGSKIYRRKPKSTPTPTKILDFEEPAETQVNTGSTPSAQSLIPAETERFQASKKSKSFPRASILEQLKICRATMNAETQKTKLILMHFLARKDRSILARKDSQEEREQYSIEDRAKFLHETIAAQRKFLAEQRYAAIRNKPPTISQLRNQISRHLNMLQLKAMLS
ncbi:hypothetical protein Tco_0366321 [Tanacetum coccineum]